MLPDMAYATSSEDTSTQSVEPQFGCDIQCIISNCPACAALAIAGNYPAAIACAIANCFGKCCSIF